MILTIFCKQTFTICKHNTDVNFLKISNNRLQSFNSNNINVIKHATVNDYSVN